MSRSYKKTRVVKDKSKSSQKLSHRKFRARSKRTLLSDLQPKSMHEMKMQYDVCDWKWIDDEKKYFGKGKDKKIFK